MKCILDTHSFLWFVPGDPRLSKTARALIGDPTNDVMVSPASYWEIAIKIRLGKYALPEPFLPFMEEMIDANDFEILPILLAPADVVSSLPFQHRDPFDRMLIAQAMVEQVPIISVDAVLDAYPVARLW